MEEWDVVGGAEVEMTPKASGHPGLKRVSLQGSAVGVVQIRWISDYQCVFGSRHGVMKPTGAFGTGVAQTEALVVSCIEEAIMWITICSLWKRARDSGRDEAARNRKSWAVVMLVEWVDGGCSHAMCA